MLNPKPKVHYPIEGMLERYQAGWTCRELSDWLLGPEWDHYWNESFGRKPKIGNQAVSLALRRAGCQMRKTGAPGWRNGSWTGGRKMVGGYVYIYQPDHPLATQGGCVLEHRLTMEKHLGRYLTRDEVVHHRDNDPANNDLDNLVLYDNNGQHLKETLTGLPHNVSPEGRQRIREAVAKSKPWVSSSLSRSRHDDWKLL